MSKDANSSTLDLLWGARAIGAALGLDERQAYYLLESGALPMAKKVGKRWAVPRAALHDFFSAPA